MRDMDREQILWTQAQKTSFVWLRHGICLPHRRKLMADIILMIFQQHGLPEESE